VKAQVERELDRLETVIDQIKAVEKERNRVLFPPTPKAGRGEARAPGAAMLTDYRGITEDAAATACVSPEPAVGSGLAVDPGLHPRSVKPGLDLGSRELERTRRCLFKSTRCASRPIRPPPQKAWAPRLRARPPAAPRSGSEPIGRA
jgi:hypothetical protein